LTRTVGVRKQPEPFVYQRALSDFYVEYELFAYINAPLRRNAPLQRAPIPSALHGEIQEEFNAHGVQIMAPHFFDQPAHAVVVPRPRHVRISRLVAP
jgi:small-conductance mechanosensitive channel